MTAAASVSGFIGYPPIANWGGFDATPKVVLGTIINVQDPFWGGGEYIYLQMPLSTTAKAAAILCWDTVAPAFLSSLVANTAGLGKPVGISQNALTSSASPQYGWAQISGFTPVWSSASVAADGLIGIVAAGQAGALAAGKQLLNCRVTVPATPGTVAKTNTQVNSGSNQLQVVNTDGWFVGMLVSGTGIPATTYVSAISADGRSVLLTNAATVTGGATITASYAATPDFWNLCVINRPMAQGQIL